MKIAYRIPHSAGADIRRCTDLAKKIGFDGIELQSQYISHLDSGCPLLSLSIGDDVNQLPSQIESAANLKCPHIRMGSSQIFDSSGVVQPKVVDALLYAGHVASENGVVILIDNQFLPGAMARLWRLLDRLSHPSIGANWNTLHAKRAGDDPAIAVPTLNSFIRSVQLQDAKVEAGTLVACDIGQGSLPIRKTMDRLRGIGFGGLAILDSTEQPGQTVTELEQTLSQAHVVLQQWQIAKTPS